MNDEMKSWLQGSYEGEVLETYIETLEHEIKALNKESKQLNKMLDNAISMLQKFEMIIYRYDEPQTEKEWRERLLKNDWVYIRIIFRDAYRVDDSD